MSVNVNTASAGIDSSDHISNTNAKVMVNGDTVFNVVGDVLIYALLSECYTVNDATASTLQYSVTNNSTATSQTISGATLTLASAAVGVSTITQLGALTNVPVISNATGVGPFPWGAIRVSNNSSIKTIIGVGSTTGTWAHYIRWEPLTSGAYISPAF